MNSGHVACAYTTKFSQCTAKPSILACTELQREHAWPLKKRIPSMDMSVKQRIESCQIHALLQHVTDHGNNANNFKEVGALRRQPKTASCTRSRPAVTESTKRVVWVCWRHKNTRNTGGDGQVITQEPHMAVHTGREEGGRRDDLAHMHSFTCHLPVNLWSTGVRTRRLRACARVKCVHRVVRGARSRCAHAVVHVGAHLLFRRGRIACRCPLGEAQQSRMHVQGVWGGPKFETGVPGNGTFSQFGPPYLGQQNMTV